MQPLAVDLRLLRALLLPETKIVPGRALMARVVSADGSGRGSLSIAGYLLEAELPPHVAAGQELRLTVREVSPQRVLLSLSDGTPPPAPEGIPLPGGGRIRVSQDDSTASGGAPGSHTLTLRYDAPALGAVDLRFELGPTSLALAVAISRTALDRAQEGSGELGDALRGAVARAVSVSITPRHEPLEIYA
jgi:hypothetical protein